MHPDLAQQEEMLAMLAEAKPTWSEPIMQMDMGWQYQHAEFVAALKGMGVVQSMSRKGNCLDNACTEGMFGHLKDEFLHGRDWDTFEAFKADLEGYIHHWKPRETPGQAEGPDPGGVPGSRPFREAA